MGTPAISDPGFLLSGHAYDRVNVTSLPGPTAFVPALVQRISTDRFVFEGFYLTKKVECLDYLNWQKKPEQLYYTSHLTVFENPSMRASDRTRQTSIDF